MWAVPVAVAHAQTSCDPNNITTDACYEQDCTGNSSVDSASCNAYALTAAGGDASCSSITSDAQYDQCCSGNSANDSAVCNAYDSSDASDDGNAPAGQPGSTAGNGSASSSGSGTSTVTNVPLNIHLQNPLAASGVTDIPSAVNLILSIVIRVALPLIIIMFIYAGMTFIFARGNPKKIETARNIFLYTVIGTLLILGAWTITNAIIGTVNTVIGS